MHPDAKHLLAIFLQCSMDKMSAAEVLSEKDKRRMATLLREKMMWIWRRTRKGVMPVLLLCIFFFSDEQSFFFFFCGCSNYSSVEHC